MEADAVSQILEFGSGAFAQHSPAGEEVPDATSRVNRRRRWWAGEELNLQVLAVTSS